MSEPEPEDVKISLKAVINKEKTKVLFAVIDNYFADVLLSFLTLPLGKIVRIMEKHYEVEAPVLGSLTTLYRGLSNLDKLYFSKKGCKRMLLNPANSFAEECRRLKFDIGDSQSIKYFACKEEYCFLSENPIIRMYNGRVRCSRCGRVIKCEISREDVYQDVGEVFTKITSTFVLTDDLEILPNDTTSVAQIFNNLGLFDIEGAECRDVTFGFNEVVNLLKWSMLSRNPLTNLVLGKQMAFYGALPFKIQNTGAPAYADLTIKVVFQKSSNKIIFVEAEEDFVEFLFSLLTIPLGKVEYLLGGNSCLRSIDKLYRSIKSPVNSKYLRMLEIIRLINPTVPHGYLSNFRIFSLDEEGPPNLYLEASSQHESGHVYIVDHYLTPFGSLGNCSFESPKGEGNYVKSPSKYMVKDDLTVTPVCMASYISTIIEKKIPLSDVDEIVLKIGLQEALGILKASLSSTCALSNGLSHLLKKNPKL